MPWGKNTCTDRCTGLKKGKHTGMKRGDKQQDGQCPEEAIDGID